MRRCYRLASLLLLSVFLLVFLVFAGYSLSAPTISLQAPDKPIPTQLFGMHIHHLLIGSSPHTPWPEISFGSWRLWDAYVAWPNLEPGKGKWNFAMLDKYVDMAQQHHVEILLPLALSPTWASARPDEKTNYALGNAAEPTDMADWRDYVRTVGTRYKGRIHEYEVWNEPNLKEFYSGSIPQMVEMARLAYTTLKEIDPSVTVSSPSATGGYGVDWLDRYLKAGGKSYADVVGYHFYVNPEPPEEMVPLIQQVEAVMEKNGVRNKMLWDTETGWAIQNTDGDVKPAPGKGFNSIVLSPEQASAYLARTYILSWASDVSRLYWFAWDNGIMGLTEKDGKTLKIPGRAYAELETWLTGARMISCASDSNGTWTSEITRNNGYRGWIVWNPNRSMDFRIPADWHTRNLHELAGGTRDLGKVQRIQVGPTPVLLENAGR